jgi:RNA-directed DNA polymerase
MRVAQYRILKEILEKISIPEYIHAFEKDKNIPSMAALHVNKRVVISLDLKDFFTSIKQYHVYQLFEHLGFSPMPARTLSELCTYKSFVPQGALTSPKLSNIVTALTFGPHIKHYCDTKGYTLSIYADDITISSDSKLDGQDGRDSIPSLIEFITGQLTRYGFKLNREKIKVMSNYQRQYVCGAVVNQKVNMQKRERHKLRAIIHNCERNGIVNEAAKNQLTAGQFTSKIMGKLNWFAQLNPEAGEREKEKFKQVCADQIMCPTAETGSVKEVGPLDSLPAVSSLTEQGEEINKTTSQSNTAPWL